MDLKDLKVMDMGMRWKQQVKLKLLFKFPQTIIIMYITENILIDIYLNY